MSMSLTARVKAVLKSNMNRPPERAADPRHLLDDSYERQVELLQDVRRGLAEVATAKKRIELQGADLSARHDRLGEQAYEAVAQQRDDLARIALTRRAAVEAQMEMLREQHGALATEELLETGGLTDFTGSADADLDRRITEVARTAQVDKQLAAIKQDVLTSGAGPTRKALSE